MSDLDLLLDPVLITETEWCGDKMFARSADEPVYVFVDKFGPNRLVMRSFLALKKRDSARLLGSSSPTLCA